MKALKCKTLGGILTRRLLSVLGLGLVGISVDSPSLQLYFVHRMQNCIRVRMRCPSVLPYAKYGAIFASSYLACYTPDATVTSV